MSNNLDKMEVRIQKFLSEAGVSSRRGAEELIKQGLVEVNGKILNELGTKINPEKDIIKVKGKEIRFNKHIYLLLNKPKGYVSSFSHAGKKTLKSLVKLKEHLGYAGRLDEDSEGLMLLTNDGDLIYKLTHPKFEHEKEYIVETKENINDAIIERLSKGMTLFEGRTNPVRVKRLSANRLNIILNEGKKRQIRRMLQILKLNVKSLKRIRIENLTLGNLKPGETRDLTKEELEKLKKLV